MQSLYVAETLKDFGALDCRHATESNSDVEYLHSDRSKIKQDYRECFLP
jgi:hypothetical protein